MKFWKIISQVKYIIEVAFMVRGVFEEGKKRGKDVRTGKKDNK